MDNPHRKEEKRTIYTLVILLVVSLIGFWYVRGVSSGSIGESILVTGVAKWILLALVIIYPVVITYRAFKYKYVPNVYVMGGGAPRIYKKDTPVAFWLFVIGRPVAWFIIVRFVFYLFRF